MEILRLFTGIMMIAMVVLAVRLVVHVDAWRSAVSAVHLRWEREQRQAAPNGVSLAQRQAVQTEFEQLVANRPYRLIWMHLLLGLGSALFTLVLAWDQDDLRLIGLWLALPLGLTIAAVLGYGWLLINQANSKLAAISSSLYGPAPPRVKVRSLQASDPD